MNALPPSLALYRAATTLFEPLALQILRGRARAGKEDPARLAERLGRAAVARPAGPLVWLHGVSVGESLSLLPLVEGLGRRRPDLALLVTSGTRTAADILARRLPPGVIHQFAPVDGPRAVGRFLDHWKPSLGVLVESELWPNLLLSAERRGVPLALLSARMTETSAKGWARAPAAARRLLSGLAVVAPQDEDSRARLERLGARPGPALNLKRLGDAPPHDPADLDRLKAAVAGRRVALAASTHPGEEAFLAQAFQAVRAGAPDALFIVVPRHPERGAEAAETLKAAGFSVARRSLGEPPAAQVYVADTLGEMGLFLRLADAVVMGGAFVDGVGGHNPLEAARLGQAVVTGPHAFNAAELYRDLLAEAAAIEADTPGEVARHVLGLLDNPRVARRMGEAALAHAEREASALDAALDRLEPLMSA